VTGSRSRTRRPWIADRMQRIDASGIRKVFDLAATMKDPINLSIGQPHFDTPEPIKQAFLSVKRGGTAVVVGVPPFGQEVSVPGAMLVLQEKSLIGSLYGSANLRRDMPGLIDLYMQKRLKIDELISRTIKLDAINSAFEAMEKGEVARSVIVYDA
jgi:Zn-dependent alcohol dehydrogenase